MDWEVFDRIISLVLILLISYDLYLYHKKKK